MLSKLVKRGKKREKEMVKGRLTLLGQGEKKQRPGKRGTELEKKNRFVEGPKQKTYGTAGVLVANSKGPKQKSHPWNSREGQGGDKRKGRRRTGGEKTLLLEAEHREKTDGAKAIIYKGKDKGRGHRRGTIGKTDET